MLYLLYGNDEFSIAETVANLKARLAEADPMAGLNTVELDGRALSVAELRATADTLPFFGERRLVIVRHLVARCNPRQGDAAERKRLADELIAYLPQVAPSCRLVLVEPALDGNNPVLRWLRDWAHRQRQDGGEVAYVREFPAPRVDQLPGWLARRAKELGAQLEPAAAEALAEALVRDKTVDLRLAASELEKLALYAAGRSIRAQDVALLVTPISLDSVFAFVDALAGRQGPAATSQLHRFLNAGEPPLRLLSMIVRQFRLLVRTRALLEKATQAEDLASTLGVPPFVAAKLARQAQRFSAPFLRQALVRLRDVDHAIKTGQTDPVLALDLFVAWVCCPAQATATQAPVEMVREKRARR